MSEKLSLDHQKLLTDKFKVLIPFLSEYSFANLYLFRDLHDYKVLFEDELYIQGVTRQGETYIMPTAIPRKENIHTIQKLLYRFDFLFPIPEEWVPQFDPLQFSSTFYEDESDYLYHREKLAYYPGRHLSKKRNLVKQLLSDHQVEAVDFTASQHDIALTILQSWQQETGLPKNQTDFYPCQEAIHLFDQLHLTGRLFYVDQIPSGFIIGEYLNPNCFVTHFEKGFKSTKGIYQYLLQDLALSIDESCSWINLEQDLGSAAIRQSKHSYQPDMMKRKFRIRNCV